MKKIIFFLMTLFVVIVGCYNEKSSIEKVKNVFPNCEVMQVDRNYKFIVICPDDVIIYVETMDIFNNRITKVEKAHKIKNYQ